MNRNTHIWCVDYFHEHNGLCYVSGYFTSQRAAEDRAAEIDKDSSPRVTQCELWQDGDRWYKVTRKEVCVDVPSKKAILDKLTVEERKVLGVE